MRGARLRRRGVGRWTASALALAVVAGGCAGGDEGGSARPGWEPSAAPVIAEGSGVLWPGINPGDRPVGDVRRVSDAAPADPPGAGLVLAKGGTDPLNDPTVIVRRAPAADADAIADADRTVPLPGGRQAVEIDAGDADGTCARGVAFDAPSGGGALEVLTVSGDDDDVEAVAAVADLDADGRPVVTRRPPRWDEIGRLDPGWTNRPGASQVRYRLVSGTTVTAVDMADAEQRVLAAQLCRQPGRTYPARGSVTEPDEEWVGKLGGHTPARWVVRERVSVTGLLDAHTKVLLVPGAPGLTLLSRFDGAPQLDDKGLADYGHGLERIADEEFDRRAAAVADGQRAVAAEVVRRALVADGYEPVEVQSRDGLAWSLSLGPAAPRGRSGRALCLTPFAYPDGTAVLGNERHPVPDPTCVGLVDPPPAGRLQVPAPADQQGTGVVWGLAGPGVASVILVRADGTAVEAPTAAIPDAARPVGVTTAPAIFVLSAPEVADDVAGTGLTPGLGVLVARRSDGTELSRVDLSRP